ncbi:hypothetical protein A2U01_0085172, partial [Trifolium medium]|nr:hypothetical protein [Trifolium medium]
RGVTRCTPERWYRVRVKNESTLSRRGSLSLMASIPITLWRRSFNDAAFLVKD